jgi:antitoxin ChpS
MPTVNIRKQGGAAIMTIPADVLKELAVGVGETLELEVADGVMHARPARCSARRRYSVAELLEGITPAVARKMTRESAAWHSGPSVGRELP